MKRRIEESVAKVEGLPQHQIQRSPHTGTSVVQTSFGTSQSLKGASTGEVGSLQQQYPIQSYVTMPSITTSIKPQSSVLPVSGTASGGPGILVQQPHIRQNKVTTPGSGPPNSSSGGASVGASNNQQQFQRLKVEDALSYLDQVKYKFNNQPQVYNDFLEIMKEFKSQCIDTPGVITRVSNLFKGYPELISGFNTFLPPGYKIEVQANDTGYSLQVSVSNPLGHHTMTEIPPLTPTQPPSVVVTNQQSKVPPAVYGTSPGILPNSSKPIPERGASGGASALQVLGSSNLPPSQPTNHQSTTNQPVEFNHAINYVNKIKNRFQGQPDKYKKFLEILHTYQKEQRNVKETSGNTGGGGKHLTEAEVYSQVAQLFENHDDLLAEFGQFLPDATSHNSLSLANLGNKISDRVKSTQGGKYHHHHHHTSSNTSSTTNNKNSPPSTKPTLGIGGKRSATELYSPSVPPLTTTASTIKRQKLQSSAAPGSNANIPSLANHTYSEQFVQLKKCLRSPGAYESVLKCVHLYNCEVISRSELIILLTPLLHKHPEHLSWLKDTLGVTGDVIASPASPTLSDPPTIAPPLHLAPSESTTSDIDFTTCKRIGASYCALPKGSAPPRCSGRTQLCRQVLNDTWVSFPTWSEEATFVTSRKTQYEEYIYRCEDERFELDLVIECNAATIKVLDGVQRKMSRMTQEELAKFRLDDSLGGTSSTIHLKALKRIYGDKSGDIVEGLKKNPSVAVPIVLRRLKSKELEWRQAQKGFNKVWREQNEKYYLKSLDHQGINFKQNDLKALRSKPLYNEIETAYDERQERDDNKTGPHMVLTYPDKTALDDAANLLIHHVKRQTAIHKSDKTRIKQLLRHFLPDMFHHRRQDLSDDELDSDDKVEVDANSRGTSPNNVKKESNGPTSKKDDIKPEVKVEKKEDEDLPGVESDPNDSDDEYTLFYGNNHWYLFLRLHHILCERLAKMAERSAKIAEEENANSQFRKESTAVALRLKPNEHCTDCYGTMLEMVKSVLDCSMDPSTYEDTLRNMFGIHAYIGFTLDRIVSYAVRQVQSLVTEDVCCEMWDTFQKMKSQGGAGGKLSTAELRTQDEAVYHKQALGSLPDSALDNFYKIYIYKKDCKVTIELMDTEGEEEDTKPAEEGKWSQHDDGPVLSAEDRERWGKAVFLKRNVKDWERKNKEKQRLKEKEKTNSGENNKLADHDGKCLLQDEDMVIFSYKDRLLYKSKALTRARLSHNRVSRRMLERVQRWHERWARENVSPPTEERSRAWFLGKVEGIRPGLVTTSRSDNSLSRPPYRPYNRYSVLAR